MSNHPNTDDMMNSPKAVSSRSGLEHCIGRPPGAVPLPALRALPSPARREAGRSGCPPFPLQGVLVLLILLAAGGASVAETLDRGVVAFSKADGGLYVGWRLLGSDPPDVTFDVLGTGANASATPPARLNPRPIRESCNYVGTQSDPMESVRVRAVSKGRVIGESDAVRVRPADANGGTIGIRLQGDYSFNRVGIADLNGDGVYDYVIKQPGGSVDPGRARFSPDTYKVEAYDGRTGAFLWRHDLGWNINMGIWFSPMIVHDFDGDGKAEVALKTAPPAESRDESHVKQEGPGAGFVVEGPEYCSVLDGMTGREIARVGWVQRGDPVDWGDNRGNRVNRNLIGLAHLDGKTPSLLVCRGTYTLMRVDAWNLVDGRLQKVWSWSGDDESPPVRGQGMHGMHAVDVDEDGRDEIVLGSAVLDDHGRLLWSTGMGHPDSVYVTDIIPDRPGLEIAYGYESPQSSNGICVVDARTGEIIWGHPHATTHIHDQGMLADIDPENPGMEFYAAEKDRSGSFLYAARTGKLLSTDYLDTISPRAFYWTDGPVKVYSPFNYRERSNRVLKYRGGQIAEFEGRIVAIADVAGDWREELIVSVAGELRVHTTTVPSTRRRVCMMQDRLYRTDVALQAMGYFFPPQPGVTKE